MLAVQDAFPHAAVLRYRTQGPDASLELASFHADGTVSWRHDLESRDISHWGVDTRADPWVLLGGTDVDPSLVAVRPADGVRAWTRPVAAGGGRWVLRASPVLVVVASGTSLTLVNRATGEVGFLGEIPESGVRQEVHAWAGRGLLGDTTALRILNGEGTILAEHQAGPSRWSFGGLGDVPVLVWSAPDGSAWMARGEAPPVPIALSGTVRRGGGGRGTKIILPLANNGSASVVAVDPSGAVAWTADLGIGEFVPMDSELALPRLAVVAMERVDGSGEIVALNTDDGTLVGRQVVDGRVVYGGVRAVAGDAQVWVTQNGAYRVGPTGIVFVPHPSGGLAEPGGLVSADGVWVPDAAGVTYSDSPSS
jgi:hypothetical protein